jgi:aryl-alcohol dehydrogenase-like predicted oxidoreductase
MRHRLLGRSGLSVSELCLGAPIGAGTAEQRALSIAAAGEALPPEIVGALGAMSPPELGFPHELAGSPCLRRHAPGDPASLSPPARPRC